MNIAKFANLLIMLIFYARVIIEKLNKVDIADLKHLVNWLNANNISHNVKQKTKKLKYQPLNLSKGNLKVIEKQNHVVRAYSRPKFYFDANYVAKD